MKIMGQLAVELSRLLWEEEENRRNERMAWAERWQASSSTPSSAPLNPPIPTELQTPAPKSPPCEPPGDSLTSQLGKHALGPLLLLIMANNTHMSGLLATQDTLLKKLSESLISQDN
jgi:hypothetical protein